MEMRRLPHLKMVQRRAAAAKILARALARQHDARAGSHHRVGAAVWVKRNLRASEREQAQPAGGRAGREASVPRRWCPPLGGGIVESVAAEDEICVPGGTPPGVAAVAAAEDDDDEEAEEDRSSSSST